MKFFLSKNKKEIKNNERGFTLVETLVAVAIFAVSIAALMSTVARGIASTTVTKNRIAANFLAQEDIEYMRHMRNKYAPTASSNLSWTDFMNKIGPCESAACTFEDASIADP